MKVILISGSLSESSHTLATLDYLTKLLEEMGCVVSVWDLKRKPLPIILPEYHNHPGDSPYEVVREFVKEVALADALILGTPLYHGSYSGALKNALDNLASDAFKGKIVGLTSNAGGIRNPQACEHLRSVVRTLYGHATQTQIGTQNSDFTLLNNTYEITDEDVKNRCERMVEEIVGLVSGWQTYFKTANN